MPQYEDVRQGVTLEQLEACVEQKCRVDAMWTAQLFQRDIYITWRRRWLMSFSVIALWIVALALRWIKLPDAIGVPVSFLVGLFPAIVQRRMSREYAFLNKLRDEWREMADAYLCEVNKLLKPKAQA